MRSGESKAEGEAAGLNTGPVLPLMPGVNEVGSEAEGVIVAVEASGETRGDSMGDDANGDSGEGNVDREGAAVDVD